MEVLQYKSVAYPCCGWLNFLLEILLVVWLAGEGLTQVKLLAFMLMSFS